MPGPGDDEKTERRAAQETVAAYQRTQLGGLLGRVRSGFDQLDAGQIDEEAVDPQHSVIVRGRAQIRSTTAFPRRGLYSDRNLNACGTDKGLQPPNGKAYNGRK
jgi:hypothetical protein